MAVLIPRHDEPSSVSFPVHGLYGFFHLSYPTSTLIMLMLFPSDSKLDEELWFYAQEFQHSFSQISISSERARSRVTPSRAEHK